MPVSSGIISEKSKSQILRKIQNRWYWGPKWPIYPILGKTRIFLHKKGPLAFVYWILTLRKKIRKKYWAISFYREKGVTDGATDRPEFMGRGGGGGGRGNVERKVFGRLLKIYKSQNLPQNSNLLTIF